MVFHDFQDDFDVTFQVSCLILYVSWGAITQLFPYDIFKIHELLTYLQFVGRWSAGAREEKWACREDWIGYFFPFTEV